MASIKTREDQGTLEGFGKPLPQSGILMPHMAHQFRVNIDNRDLLMMQTMSVVLDMMNRQVTVRIQQPHGFGDEVLRDISLISNRFNVPFKLELMDGAGGVCSSIVGYCKVLNHKFELSYEKNEPAVHVLNLHYEPSAV